MAFSVSVVNTKEKKLMQLLVCDCEATSVRRCCDSSPQRCLLNSSVLFLELLFIGTDN